MSKLLHVLAVVLLATPAFAEGAETKPAPDKNKQICKRISVTGSLARVERICATKAEWEARSREGRAYGENVQDSGRISSAVPAQ